MRCDQRVAPGKNGKRSMPHRASHDKTRYYKYSAGNNKSGRRPETSAAAVTMAALCISCGSSAARLLIPLSGSSKSPRTLACAFRWVNRFASTWPPLPIVLAYFVQAVSAAVCCTAAPTAAPYVHCCGGTAGVHTAQRHNLLCPHALGCAPGRG